MLTVCLVSGTGSGAIWKSMKQHVSFLFLRFGTSLSVSCVGFIHLGARLIPKSKPQRTAGLWLLHPPKTKPKLCIRRRSLRKDASSDRNGGFPKSCHPAINHQIGTPPKLVHLTLGNLQLSFLCLVPCESHPQSPPPTYRRL